MHNHNINEESVRKKELLSQLKKLALESDFSGQALLETLDIKEDVEKYLSFIRTCRSRARKKETLNPPEPAVNVGLDYRKILSRIKSKEMIYHDGYIYRQDSRNKNEGAKSKSKYWRCKEKSCRARGKTDEKDNLIIIQSKHSHPPDKTEETSEELKERLRNEVLTTDKSAKVIISEFGISDPGLKRFVTNLKKSNESQEIFKTVEQLEDDIEVNVPEGNLVLTDSEAFSIEKLMASTLEDSYGVSFDLLKN